MTIQTTLWRAATLLVVTVSTAHAQVDVYVSADVGTRQPATSAFTQTAASPLRFEEASLSARYAIAAARAFDGRVGFSRALTRRWAVRTPSFATSVSGREARAAGAGSSLHSRSTSAGM